MFVEDQCVLDAYRTIATLNSEHSVDLVQNIYSSKIYVRKTLTEYSRPVFDYLLNHPIPNMPGIIELVETDGTLTVIEEYIHGDTLQYRIENSGPLREADAARIALQICSTLQALHQADPPIIHRDIKPGNIIITPDGVAKLLDMNAAKQITGNRSCDTRVLGTVGYAAPEQYGFQQSSVQTDIYAMGVLLNVMVTGDFPAHRRADGRLAAVIQRCIELSPKDRFPTVADLAHALRSFAVCEPTGPVEAEPVVRYPWQRFLPPGFRSLRPGSVLTSLLLYAFGFAVIASMTVQNPTPRALLVNRVGMSLLLLALIFFNGNYLGIHETIPGMKHPNPWLRYLIMVLYDAVFLVLGVIIIGILE